MVIDLTVILYVALACYLIGGLLLGLACFWAACLLVRRVLPGSLDQIFVSKQDISNEPDIGDYVDLLHPAGRA